RGGLLGGSDDDRGPLDRVRFGQLGCGDGVFTGIAGAEGVDVVCRHTANVHTAAGCDPGERLLSVRSGDGHHVAQLDTGRTRGAGEVDGEGAGRRQVEHHGPGDLGAAHRVWSRGAV